MKKIYKEKEIAKVVSCVFDKFLSQRKEKAVVLAFVGELGAGKTTLVKNMALKFGIKESVVSPTFVVSKAYDIKNNKIFKKLIHIDAYRLKSKIDLKNIGFFEQVKNPDNLIIVEWADLIYDFLPNDTKKIKFQYNDSKSRKIIF